MGMGKLSMGGGVFNGKLWIVNGQFLLYAGIIFLV